MRVDTGHFTLHGIGIIIIIVIVGTMYHAPARMCDRLPYQHIITLLTTPAKLKAKPEEKKLLRQMLMYSWATSLSIQLQGVYLEHTSEDPHFIINSYSVLHGLCHKLPFPQTSLSLLLIINVHSKPIVWQNRVIQTYLCLHSEALHAFDSINGACEGRPSGGN